MSIFHKFLKNKMCLENELLYSDNSVYNIYRFLVET